jgi:elongation factor P
MAIDVNQLRKSTTFTEDGQLYKVIDYQHIKPGRGSATIRVKVRNLRSGSIVELTYPSGNTVQDIRLDNTEVEYLYDDGEFLNFIDNNTFEQPQLRRDIFDDDITFLKPGMVIRLSSYEGEILDYELPSSVDLEVIESEMAVAGDTANNPTKKVTVETGRVVRVPMFVNVGDVIRIKTEDGSYMTRV